MFSCRQIPIFQEIKIRIGVNLFIAKTNRNQLIEISFLIVRQETALLFMIGGTNLYLVAMWCFRNSPLISREMFKKRGVDQRGTIKSRTGKSRQCPIRRLHHIGRLTCLTC